MILRSATCFFVDLPHERLSSNARHESNKTDIFVVH